jgi:hypothetical protein
MAVPFSNLRLSPLTDSVEPPSAVALLDSEILIAPTVRPTFDVVEPTVSPAARVTPPTVSVAVFSTPPTAPPAPPSRPPLELCCEDRAEPTALVSVPKPSSFIEAPVLVAVTEVIVAVIGVVRDPL